MKKLLFISALLVMTLIGQSALAQNNRGNRQGQGQGERQRVSFAERQANILESLTTSLSLTEDQVAKTKVLNTKYDEKFTALRSGASSPEDRQAQRTQMRELMNQYNTEFKTILTEEQAKKYDEMMQKRRDSRQRSQRGNQGSGRERQRRR